MVNYKFHGINWFSSERIFFLLFVFIIIELNIDMSIGYALIGFAFIILDILVNHHTMKQIKFNRGTKIYLIYEVFLCYEFLITLVAAPIEVSRFWKSGLFVYLAADITTFIFVLYFSQIVCWKKFLVYIKYLGSLLSIAGVLETIERKYIIHDLVNFIKPFELVYEKTINFRTCVVFISPTLAATFFLIVFMIHIYYPYKNMVIQYFSLALILVAIYGTRTRIIWLSLVAILLLIVIKNSLLQKKARRDSCTSIINKRVNKITGEKVICLFVCVVFVFIIIFWGYSKIVNAFKDIHSYLNLIINKNSSQGSKIIRVKNIKNVFDYFLNSPFYIFTGRGLGYDLRFSFENPVVTSDGIVWNSAIDNQYLSTLLDAGLIGIFLYFNIIYLAIKNFFMSKSIQTVLGSIFVISIGFLSFSVDAFWWKIACYFLQSGIMMIESRKNPRQRAS